MVSEIFSFVWLKVANFTPAYGKTSKVKESFHPFHRAVNTLKAIALILKSGIKTGGLESTKSNCGDEKVQTWPWQP